MMLQQQYCNMHSWNCTHTFIWFAAPKTILHETHITSANHFQVYQLLKLYAGKLHPLPPPPPKKNQNKYINKTFKKNTTNKTPPSQKRPKYIYFFYLKRTKHTPPSYLCGSHNKYIYIHQQRKAVICKVWLITK